MKLESAYQVRMTDVNSGPIDAVLAASGYESRASFVVSKTKFGSGTKKLVLGFADRHQIARETNDRKFKKLGFKIENADGATGTDVKALLRTIVSESSSGSLSILIDYSSMTRTWYAAIINFFKSEPLKLKRADIYFAYSLSTYSRPHKPSPNAVMDPIPGFCQLHLPHRETALVIGLGYERDRALGLAEYIEARETYAFYADPAIDSQFPRTVQENNRELLNRIGPNRVFSYPIADLKITDSILSSLCKGLIGKFRVILAPLGPKPFSLLCLLLATRVDGLDVWRVSAGKQSSAIERSPSGRILVCKATFTNDADQATASL